MQRDNVLDTVTASRPLSNGDNSKFKVSLAQLGEPSLSQDPDLSSVLGVHIVPNSVDGNASTAQYNTVLELYCIVLEFIISVCISLPHKHAQLESNYCQR